MSQTKKRGRPRDNPDKLNKAEQQKEKTEIILSVLENSCKRRDALDIPEFVAYEVIDLAEWICNINIRSQVVEQVLSSSFPFPEGSNGIIKRYFGLL